MKELDEKVFNVYTEYVLNERKFDLGSGHMGNGIVVWNRAKEVHGDYEKIAHINQDRKIEYYIKNPPNQVLKYVEKIAKGKNPSVSTSQKHMKVFKEETMQEGIKDFIDDSKVADKIFKEMKGIVNKIVMSNIIPIVKKEESKLVKKYNISSDSTMFVKNFGTAYLHDIFMELLGQQLVNRGNLKNFYMNRQ